MQDPGGGNPNDDEDVSFHSIQSTLDPKPSTPLFFAIQIFPECDNFTQFLTRMLGCSFTPDIDATSEACSEIISMLTAANVKIKKELVDYQGIQDKHVKKSLSNTYPGINSGLVLPAEFLRLFEILKLVPDLNSLPYYFPARKDAASIAKTSRLFEAVEEAKHTITNLGILAKSCHELVSQTDKKITQTVNSIASSPLNPPKIVAIGRSRSLSASAKRAPESIDLTQSQPKQPKFNQIVAKNPRSRKNSTSIGTAVISGNPLLTFAVCKPAAVKLTIGKNETNNKKVIDTCIKSTPFFEPHLDGMKWDFLHESDHSETYRLSFKNWPQSKNICNPAHWPVGLSPKKWNGEIFNIDQKKLKSTRTFRIGGPMLPATVTCEKMKDFLLQIASTDGLTDFENLDTPSTNHTIIVQEFAGKGKNLDANGDKKFCNFVAKITTIDGSPLSDAFTTFFDRHDSVHIHNWSGPLPETSNNTKRSKLSPFNL